MLPLFRNLPLTLPICHLVLVLLLGIKIIEKHIERQLLLQLKISEICDPAYLVKTLGCLGGFNLLWAIAEKVVSGQMILTHGCLQRHWFYSIGGSTWNVGRIGCNSGMHLFQSTGIHSHWCSNFAKPYLPFYFLISLYKKSLRPLGGLTKRHLSNVVSLLIQRTLCSVLLYHRSVELWYGWCLH